jgi:chemotaxis response regulator CheB
MKTFLTHAVLRFLHLCLIPLPAHVLAFVVLKHMPPKTFYESVRKLQKRGSKSSVKEGPYHRDIQQ